MFSEIVKVALIDFINIFLTQGEALSKDFEKVWTKWTVLDTRKRDIQVTNLHMYRNW